VLVGFVAASRIGVLCVARKSMCPAIIKLNAVAIESGCGISFAAAVGIFFTAWCGRRSGCRSDAISAVESSSTCGHFAMTLLFMLGEMEHKIGPGVVCFVLVIPSGYGVIVDTSFLESF
jgi:hypothetical protein